MAGDAKARVESGDSTQRNFAGEVATTQRKTSSPCVPNVIRSYIAKKNALGGRECAVLSGRSPNSFGFTISGEVATDPVPLNGASVGELGGLFAAPDGG